MWLYNKDPTLDFNLTLSNIPLTIMVRSGLTFWRYVTWSSWMSPMLAILILSYYKLKEVTNSCVFTLFRTSKNVHIYATKCLTEMSFKSKCSILSGQIVFIEKSKLNIANMWLIPLIASHIMMNMEKQFMQNTPTWYRKILLWSPRCYVYEGLTHNPNTSVTIPDIGLHKDPMHNMHSMLQSDVAMQSEPRAINNRSCPKYHSHTLCVH